METSKPDWATVTQFEVGQVMHERFAVMLRLHFQLPTLPGTPPAPVQTTLPLYLTERQAKDLLLALGRQLGFPGTGMPETPSAKGH